MKHLLIINQSQFGYISDYFYYSKYLQAKYKITIVCIDSGKPRKIVEGVQVHYVRKRKLIDSFALFIKGAALIAKIKPDLYIVNMFPLCFLFPLIFFRRKGLFDIRSGGVSGSKHKRYRRNFRLKFNSMVFPYVSVLSSSLAELLKIDHRKLFVFPLGSEIFSVQKKRSIPRCNYYI